MDKQQEVYRKKSEATGNEKVEYNYEKMLEAFNVIEEEVERMAREPSNIQIASKEHVDLLMQTLNDTSAANAVNEEFDKITSNLDKTIKSLKGLIPQTEKKRKLKRSEMYRKLQKAALNDESASQLESNECEGCSESDLKKIIKDTI